MRQLETIKAFSRLYTLNNLETTEKRLLASFLISKYNNEDTSFFEKSQKVTGGYLLAKFKHQGYKVKINERIMLKSLSLLYSDLKEAGTSLEEIGNALLLLYASDFKELKKDKHNALVFASVITAKEELDATRKQSAIISASHSKARKSRNSTPIVYGAYKTDWRIIQLMKSPLTASVTKTRCENFKRWWLLVPTECKEKKRTCKKLFIADQQVNIFFEDFLEDYSKQLSIYRKQGLKFPSSLKWISTPSYYQSFIIEASKVFSKRWVPND